MGCEASRDNKKLNSTDNKKPNSSISHDKQKQIENEMIQKAIQLMIANEDIKLSQKLRKVSDDLEESGQYSDALELELKVLQIQKKSNNPELIAKTYIKIGELLYKIESYSDSYDNFSRVLNLQNLPSYTYQKSIKYINAISDNLLFLGKLEFSIIYRKDALAFQVLYYGRDQLADQMQEQIDKCQDLYQQIEQFTVLEINLVQSEDDDCMICCKNFTKNENLIKLQCKHSFHQECIIQWFLKQKNCPYCRKELKI